MRQYVYLLFHSFFAETCSPFPFPLPHLPNRSIVRWFVSFHVFILSLSLSLWFYLMISSECHECIYISPELEINKIERKPKSSPGSHAHAALQYPTNCRHFHKFFLSLLLTLFCPIQSLLFFSYWLFVTDKR